MANKKLFKSAGPKVPTADAVNEAGGVAYAMSPEHALAQLAMTGTIADTYYSTAEEQLIHVIDLLARVNDEFVLKVAVYARERGLMKDMPALLLAAFAGRRPEAAGLASYASAWERCIDTGKMLRNFCQIVRSGATGRTTFPRPVRRLVKQWFAKRSTADIFYHSVGNDPSMRDILRMFHPHPGPTPTPSESNRAQNERAALYGYLVANEKRPYEVEALPAVVRDFEVWKLDGYRPAPRGVPFELLTGALNLTPAHWRGIASVASWTQTRMNLNTFLRHGVFDSRELVYSVAERLSNLELLQKARPFPYQLMQAYRSVDDKMPRELTEALQDAMELATANVPVFEGDIVIMPDVSGSMRSSVTGVRGSATTKTCCIDIAALVAATFMRKNPRTVVMPFAENVRQMALNPRDSIMTNAGKLASIGGGGTNCAAPLVKLNTDKTEAPLLVFVSDNQSWIDVGHDRAYYGGTGAAIAWIQYKQRVPGAKLVCIDIQSGSTTQAQSTKDVLNIGGFSDSIFKTVAEFARGGSGDVDVWVKEVNAIVL